MIVALRSSGSNAKTPLGLVAAALAVFLKDSPGESISKERKQWEKVYIAPGALDRWLNHMRVAGMPEQ